jgi:cardiolipin synthase
MPSQILTLPNAITGIRFILIPIFVIAILSGNYGVALAAFVSASVSDWVDGWLARALKQQTDLGAVLDPIADKGLLITAVVVFSVHGWIPLWLAMLLIGRDLVVVLGWVLLTRILVRGKVRPTFAGKTAIAAEMILLSYVLFWITFPGLPEPAAWMFYGVAALSVGSGVHYMYRGFLQTNENSCTG